MILLKIVGILMATIGWQILNLKPTLKHLFAATLIVFGIGIFLLR